MVSLMRPRTSAVLKLSSTLLGPSTLICVLNDSEDV